MLARCLLDACLMLLLQDGSALDLYPTLAASLDRLSEEAGNCAFFWRSDVWRTPPGSVCIELGRLHLQLGDRVVQARHIWMAIKQSCSSSCVRYMWGRKQ